MIVGKKIMVWNCSGSGGRVCLLVGVFFTLLLVCSWCNRGFSLLHGVFAFTGEVTLHICHAVDFGTVRRFQGKDLTSDFVVSAQFNRCYSVGFKLLKAALQFEQRYDKAFSWPAMSCDWLGCLHVVYILWLVNLRRLEKQWSLTEAAFFNPP